MKVAIISDIHANIHALDAVYAEIDSASVDRILVSGDLVGYYYWPKEVIDRLRNDARVSVIRGNHENILREFMTDETCVDKYRRKYGSGYDVCLNTLGSEELEWLTTLPETLELDIFGHSFYLSHGSLNDVDEYLYPDTDPVRLEANFSSSNFTIFGHTHYPFLCSKGDRTMLNPGSVGQPRDKGGLASFVILNLQNKAIQFKRCAFDTAKVCEAAKAIDPELDYLWKIMSR